MVLLVQLVLVVLLLLLLFVVVVVVESVFVLLVETRKQLWAAGRAGGTTAGAWAATVAERGRRRCGRRGCR